jgi:hypothetical protein
MFKVKLGWYWSIHGLILEDGSGISFNMTQLLHPQYDLSNFPSEGLQLLVQGRPPWLWR